MSRTSIFVILACIVAVLLIAGCTQQPAQTPVQTTVVPAQGTPATTPALVSAGMANPASVNCGNIGGTTQIMSNPDGSQYGMCTFPNGTTCEEWALFNDHVCKPYVQAATTPAAIGMANPASVNCGNIGGTTQIMSNPDGSQYGMCTFPNGTTCEEWALYRNEGCKPNVYVAPATAATNASTSSR